MRTIGIERSIDARIYAAALLVRSSILKEGGGSSWGMCGDATSLLVGEVGGKFIKGAVYSSKWCRGYAHCWVLIDGIILDVTADQFNDKDYYPHEKDIYFNSIIWCSAYRLRKIYIKGK
jgi:hypothetical protein